MKTKNLLFICVLSLFMISLVSASYGNFSTFRVGEIGSVSGGSYSSITYQGIKINVSDNPIVIDIVGVLQPSATFGSGGQRVSILYENHSLKSSANCDNLDYAILDTELENNTVYYIVVDDYGREFSGFYYNTPSQIYSVSALGFDILNSYDDKKLNDTKDFWLQIDFINSREIINDGIQGEKVTIVNPYLDTKIFSLFKNISSGFAIFIRYITLPLFIFLLILVFVFFIITTFDTIKETIQKVLGVRK